MAEDKKQLDRMEEMLTQLIDIVGKTNASVSELRKEVSSLHTGQDEVKASVERIEAQQALTEKRLNSHKRQLADLREDVDVLEQGQQ